MIIIIICSWLFVCNSIVSAQEWKELDSLRDVYLAKQHLDSALIYAEKAAQAVKKQYGEKDTLYADMITGILTTYYYMGKLEKALEYGLIEKKIRKELQGKTHQDYASSLNNLAAIYDEMGKYDKAEPLYLESMNIDKEVLGDKHPSYANDLNNLAYLYYVLGKYEKAEALYIEAKNIYKEVYGIKHTDYATSINNLAALYKNIGNYQKAESLYIEAIDIKKEILGDKHPSYSKSLNNLANLYTTIGEYEKAEPLYLKALSIYKEVLGKKHTSYATSLINIAFLYYEMGDYKKAEPYYIEALAIDREVLGEKHPYYAISLNNLAGLYRTMGNYEKAEDLYKKAKKIRKEVFGREHLAYAESSNNLASLYFLIGHYTYDKKLAMELYQKAEPLYIEAKNIRKKILGEKHPDYAVSLNNIGALYRKMGNLSSKKQDAEDLFDKAELILIEANSIDELVFGKEHQSYAKSLHNLAVLYYDMCTKWISQEQNEDMCGKAESLFVEANKIFKDALGNRHQYYIASLFDLALLFDARNDRHLAEPLFIEGVERIKYNIRENFSFLSEEEKEHYFKTVLKDFHDFNSFALKRKKDNPEIVKYVFNNAVQNKGVLLKSSTAMRAAILESRDTTLISGSKKTPISSLRSTFKPVIPIFGAPDFQVSQASNLEPS